MGCSASIPAETPAGDGPTDPTASKRRRRSSNFLAGTNIPILERDDQDVEPAQSSSPNPHKLAALPFEKTEKEWVRQYRAALIEGKPMPGDLTVEDVHSILSAYCAGLTQLAAAACEYGEEEGAVEAAVADFVDSMYGYQLGSVCFKPAVTAENRMSVGLRDEAVEYFTMVARELAGFENCHMSMGDVQVILEGRVALVDFVLNHPAGVSNMCFGLVRNMRAWPQSQEGVFIRSHHSALSFRPPTR